VNNESQERLADRLIREAVESGEFDDLPGTGEPIPGAGTVDDEYWWVSGWVRRNRAVEADQTPSSSV
jgi:hypothetical protein